MRKPRGRKTTRRTSASVSVVHRRGAGPLTICRWSVRLGAASTISALPGSVGGARTQTLGQSVADAPADVHLRASSRDPYRDSTLGANADGTLTALTHEALAETSHFEEYSENVVGWSGMLYQCDNVKLDHKVVQLDVYTPIDMRAPGASWGVYALECAMDELAYTLKDRPARIATEELRRERPKRRQTVFE